MSRYAQGQLGNAPFARQSENQAVKAAEAARDALVKALHAYSEADFGSCVTDPLRDALEMVEHSIKQVLS